MRLSQVKYSNILLSSKDFKEKIVFTQDYKKVDKKVDIGICLGGQSMIPNRADEAIRLYYEGLIEKIVLSGGIGLLNLDRRTPEAIKLYNYCREKGIPDSDLIVEDKSRNTFENIKLFLSELDSFNYNLDELTFAVITSDFHLRRSIGMLTSFLESDKNIYGAPVKDGITDMDNWSSNINGYRLILEEALMLSYYAKKEVLPDEDIQNLDVLCRRIKK